MTKLTLSKFATMPALTVTLAFLSLAAAQGNTADENAIRQSYRTLANGTLKQDTTTILQVYAPQFVGWGSRYEPMTREALAQVTPGMTLKSVELTPLKFERQGTDYLVTLKSNVAGEYSMGDQKVPFEQTQESQELWQKVAGRWQIVGSRHLNSSINMGGQQQVSADPPPLSSTQRQALSAALRPLLRPVSVQADAPLTDLNFLQGLSAARVIGVGEGSHGTHEQFVLKARIFKALVQNYDFSTLAFESNMAGAETINAYISGQSSDLQAAVSGLGFAVWRTAEIRDLLVWMRQYNATRGSKPALKFLAVDMQDPGGSARLLTELHPEFKALAAPFAVLEPYQIGELVQDPGKRDSYLKQAAELVKAAAALPQNTPRRTDLLALARAVQQAVQAASGQGTRDDFMAENLLTALKTDPQSKVMYWAHNGHISKAPDPLSQTGMGQRLVEALGAQYRTIGQTFSGGHIRAALTGQENQGMQTLPVAPAHPDSPEALVPTGAAVLVVNEAQRVPVLNTYLGIPRPVRGIGNSSWPGAMGYTFEVLPQAYDVLIFTGESTPAKAAN